MKRCKKCGALKPRDEFYKNKGGRDGLRPECKACTAARRRAWYLANREKVIAKVVAWQRENKDRYNARQRVYRRKNPDKDWPGHLKRKFGLTVEEYDAFVATHDGRCAICRDAPTTGVRLHLDHDHNSKQIRGMLCVRRNNGIGQLREDVALLALAIDYLESGGFVPSGTDVLVEQARSRATALKEVPA